MSPRREPSEERLLAYAAGTLNAPEAVVVATHLALRPTSAAFVRALQAVGGGLLEDQTPALLSPDALDQALARIETPESAEPEPSNEMTDLPLPLRRYRLGRWRTVAKGIQARTVEGLRHGRTRVILLKVEAGRSIPMHGHEGAELSCVISGRFVTDAGEYGPGDVQEADATIEHRPRVEVGGACLCVVALEGQIRLSGLFGRLMQPFVKL